MRGFGSATRALSGDLTVVRSEHGLTMDFPALPPGPSESESESAPEIVDALGAEPESLHSIRAVHGGRYYLAVVSHRDVVAALAPDVRRLGRDLLCEVRGDRVLLSGQAVTYLEGEIEVDLDTK